MSRTPRLRGIAVVAVAAMTMTMTACGSSAGDDNAATTDASAWAGLTGADREEALLAAAKREGTLMVYSAFNDEQAMADAFTAKYGIKVEVYNGNSETVLQRVQQETAADKLSNDLLVLPAVDMESINDQHVLADYESEYRDAVSSAGKGDDWTGVRRLAFVAGYNTDAVNTADLPADYSGFADKKWHDRLSMELADADWYGALVEHFRAQGMSDDDIDAMFTAIAANSQVDKGHTTQGELLSAGEFDVAVSLYSQTVDRATKDGAPLSYGDGAPAVEPVVVRYDAGALMAGAAHLAAATLYLDFQLTQGGFDLDRELGALPPVASDADPIAGATVIEQDVPSALEHRQEYIEAYDDLVTNR